MKELRLRKEMFPAILSGNKTTTSRYGFRDISIGDNIKIIASEDDDVFVHAIVTNVYYLDYNEFDEEEARNEGYETLEELKAVLEKIYNPTDCDTFTIIGFAVCENNK